LLWLLVAIVWPGASRAPAQESLSPAQQVDLLLASMTTEQKIGQLFMSNIGERQITPGTVEFFGTFQPGAVALFARNTQTRTPGEVAAFINGLQQAITAGGGPPLIVAIDQEGGRVRRLYNGVTHFPDPLMLGASTQPDAAQAVGAASGAELAALGINMNLAPVADLATEGDLRNIERVMHRRTWGDDPARVGWQTAAYINGMRAAGVIGVLKHYPGHGGAADSHATLPRIDASPEDAALARHAFTAAIDQGARAVMVGHLYYAQIEPMPDLPATLSPTQIGILRDDVGFDGVIMTDALDMAAIAERYTLPDAALRFLLAGGDMVVVGPFVNWDTQRRIAERILAAVEDGTLGEDRLNQSVRRILLLKADYDLLDWVPLDPATVEIDLAGSRTALYEAYAEGATLLRDAGEHIPFSADDNLAIVYPIYDEAIRETCARHHPGAAWHGYTLNPARWEYGAVANLAATYDHVIMFTHDAYLNEAHTRLVNLLDPANITLVALGLPFDLLRWEETSGALALYSHHPMGQVAACDALFGVRPIRGQLPLALGDYASGAGLQRP
ncbi:MAG: glycoside hydrolase family 3 protein, partial [Anaerolineales bacterium]